jgi:hypothetical protein
MLVVMVEHYADRLRQFPGGHNGPVRRLRFRHSTAVSVAAVLVIIGGVSISTWAVWLLPLLLVPLAVAVWGWRAGTDVDATGITVRAALGRRTLPWSEVTELTANARGRVEARLTSGGVLTLTAVPASRLGQVVAASGSTLVRDRPT